MTVEPDKKNRAVVCASFTGEHRPGAEFSTPPQGRAEIIRATCSRFLWETTGSVCFERLNRSNCAQNVPDPERIGFIFLAAHSGKFCQIKEMHQCRHLAVLKKVVKL